MSFFNQLIVLLIFFISTSAQSLIYVTGSSSRSTGIKCNAIIRSIGTCYAPSDIFFFNITTQNGTVSFDSKTLPPKGYELKYSTNAEGVVDGYLLSYKYSGKSSVSVSKLSSDGTKSDVGSKKLSCQL